MRVRILNSVVSALAVAALLALPEAGAEAQAPHHDYHHPHGPHGHPYHAPDFHGRDFAHFSPHNRALWRRGHWVHGWHDGRYAWWWDVGGFWYFYPTPVYPYPTYVPPAIVVQQAPPVPVGMPPASTWYYCGNPAGYYPYVASCNVAWRAVPAAPPVAPVAPPPPPPPR